MSHFIEEFYNYENWKQYLFDLKSYLCIIPMLEIRNRAQLVHLEHPDPEKKKEAWPSSSIGRASNS